MRQTKTTDLEFWGTVDCPILNNFYISTIELLPLYFSQISIPSLIFQAPIWNFLKKS